MTDLQPPLTPPSAASEPQTAASHKTHSRAHVNVLRVIIIALLAVGLLAYFGAFKANPKIALVTSSDTPYWDLVIKGANEAANMYDAKVTIVRSKGDTDSQNQAIRDLLRQKFDGIAISPVNPTEQAGLLADVAAQTTLVTFDSDSPLSSRLCFVGTDNYAAGRQCGDQVRIAVPDGGEVAIVCASLGKENVAHRRQGVIDELVDRPYAPEQPIDPADATNLKGSKYSVVATIEDQVDPNKSTEMVGAMLKDHPDVKCIVGLNSYSAASIVKALEAAGKTGKVQVVGFDADPRTLDGIRGGTVAATIVQDQFGCGFHTVRILAERARGERSGLPLFQRRTLPVEVMNKSNVAQSGERLNSATKPS